MSSDKEQEAPVSQKDREDDHVKRARISSSDDNDEPAGEGETKEEVVNDAKKEEEEATVPKDPRQLEIDELAKEFGEDQDDVQVVIGPMNNLSGTAKASTSSEAAAKTGEASVGATRARSDGLPAFRFSGASLTASLWLPMTPEIEEALRVTGVTPANYAQMINPGGKNVKRRSALEDDLDEIEYPRWRDPGAVQSDFFNYGLNEQTWKEYAARQVAIRLFRLQKAQEAHQAAQETAHDS